MGVFLESECSVFVCEMFGCYHVFLKEGKAREINKSYHVFIVIFTFLFVLELVSGLFPSKL